MARAPSDPSGKSRLTTGIGGHDVVELRQALLLDTCEVVAEAGFGETLLLFTPDDAAAEMSQLRPGTPLMAQRGGSLGERMEAGCADLFARGFAAVGLVGSDVPTVPPAYLRQAREALQGPGDRVILGPAEDGGYYFIGLRRPHPELFRDVPWGTSEVLSMTCALAKREGLSVVKLPVWYDVDSPLDLARALREPVGSGTASSRPRHLRAWYLRRTAGTSGSR